MLVSDQAPSRCLVFIHLPRTGGTTLERVLERKYRSRVISAETLWEPLSSVAELPDEVKERALVVQGHLHHGVHDYLPRDCDYITILREPVARVVSMYRFIRGNPKHWLHEELVRSGASLAEFVRAGMDPGVDNHQTRLIAGIGAGDFGRAQAELDASALALAKQNLDGFKAVGLTERFDESFIMIRRALGWRLPVYMSTNAARTGRPVALDDVDGRHDPGAEPIRCRALRACPAPVRSQSQAPNRDL